MNIPHLVSRSAPAAVLTLLLVLLLLSGGCTRPAPQLQRTPAAVSVTQIDDSHITIAYAGRPETTTLLELEVTVTDSAGKAQTKSIGDKYSTTPLKFGATLPLTGSFGGNDHVVVTGYFMDGSKQIMLDMTI